MIIQHIGNDVTPDSLDPLGDDLSGVFGAPNNDDIARANASSARRNPFRENDVAVVEGGKHACAGKLQMSGKRGSINPIWRV